MLTQEEAIRVLKETMLNFLAYSDLVEINVLFNKMEMLSDKRIVRWLIPNWRAYQVEQLELTHADFFSFFFSDLEATEEVMLITEKGYESQMVFRFFVRDFMDFSSWHEAYFNWQFFDFSDYVAIFPRLNMIRLNDDEGGMNELVVL